MSLARRIPIKDRIFTTASLASLLKELSGYYRKSTHEYRENSYELSISEDEHTTTSIDLPPKSFDPLLNSSIHYLRLRIDCNSPNRDIELTLSPGTNSRSNCIVLQSEDEDWVNLAHNDLIKLLEKVPPQSVFIRDNIWWLAAIFSLLIGWPTKKLLFWTMWKMGHGELVNWSWPMFLQHLVAAVVLGVVPAFGILVYAAEHAFPGIEFQTGSSHTWKEAKKRNQLNVLFGLLILGPLGNFIYDVYRAVVEH